MLLCHAKPMPLWIPRAFQLAQRSEVRQLQQPSINAGSHTAIWHIQRQETQVGKPWEQAQHSRLVCRCERLVVAADAHVEGLDGGV